MTPPRHHPLAREIGDLLRQHTPRLLDVAADLLDLAAQHPGALLGAVEAMALQLMLHLPAETIRSVRAWARETAGPGSTPTPTLEERGITATYTPRALASATRAGVAENLPGIIAGAKELGAAVRPGAVRLRHRRRGEPDLSLIADVISPTHYEITDLSVAHHGQRLGRALAPRPYLRQKPEPH